MDPARISGLQDLPVLHPVALDKQGTLWDVAFETFHVRGAIGLVMASSAAGGPTAPAWLTTGDACLDEGEV